MNPRVLWAILKLNLREALAYRADLAVDLLSGFILLGIYYYLWGAVFEARPEIQGLDFAFMTGYIALVRIVQGFAQTESLEDEIAQRVQDGSIALDLLRPYSLQLYAVLRVYAQSLLGALLISAPLFVFSLWVLGLPLPPLPRAGLFLLSLHLGFLVNSGISFLIGIAAFFLRSNEGLVQLRRFAIALLSGSLFPLVLLPDFVYGLIAWLPFRAVVDVPIGVYLGTHSPLWLGFQALWGLGLWVLGAWLFGVARRRLTILGG